MHRAQCCSLSRRGDSLRTSDGKRLTLAVDDDRHDVCVAAEVPNRLDRQRRSVSGLTHRPLVDLSGRQRGLVDEHEDHRDAIAAAADRRDERFDLQLIPRKLGVLRLLAQFRTLARDPPQNALSRTGSRLINVCRIPVSGRSSA